MTDAKRIFPFALIALIVFSSAHAQSFVFLSDRLPRAGAERITGYAQQTDVFLYRDGSELRLTHTDDASEYDAVPSPSGTLLAYVRVDLSPVADVPAAPAPLGWHIEVLDLVTLRIVDRWQIDGSTGMTRPAGGFQLRWLPDEQALLAQVPTAPDAWEVHRFDRGVPRSTRLTEGFGIVLDAAGSRFATEHDGVVYALDVTTGADEATVPVAVAAGTPLGWAGEEVLIALPEGMVRVSPTESGVVDVFAFPGDYGAVAWSPDGAHYAVVLQQDGYWFVIVANRDNGFVEDYQLPGPVEGLDWVADDTLVFAVEREATHFGIATLRLDGYDPVVVDSWADDFGPRVVRRGR